METYKYKVIQFCLSRYGIYIFVNLSDRFQIVYYYEKLKLYYMDI